MVYKYLTDSQRSLIEKYGKSRNWQPFKMSELLGKQITTASRLRDNWDYLNVDDRHSEKFEDWYYIWTEKGKNFPPKLSEERIGLPRRSSKKYLREYNRLYMRRRRAKNPEHFKAYNAAYRLRKKAEKAERAKNDRA